MSDGKASTTKDGGAGCLTLLGLIFITLKLTKQIDWSWWWVLAPFWGGFALLAVILILWFIGFMIVETRKKK